MNIGEAMRKVREERGWSRRELAESVITEQTLINYENGNSMPTIDKLARLACKLGVTVDEYCGLETALSFDHYARQAKRTAPELDKYEKLTNAALGLCGEAGEFAGLIKKFNYQGHDLDEYHLARELGDILWYIAQAADGISTKLSIIAHRNIEKLKVRYPEGFDEQHSRERAENDI